MGTGNRHGFAKARLVLAYGLSGDCSFPKVVSVHALSGRWIGVIGELLEPRGRETPWPRER